jgi:hypothetical protein
MIQCMDGRNDNSKGETKMAKLMCGKHSVWGLDGAADVCYVCDNPKAAPTYSDLSTAAGILDRAARYLISCYIAELRAGRVTNTDDAAAAGTLMGLAYQIRPVKVTLG